MINKIISRLSSLREIMKETKVNACIIPSTDAHMSEYIANHWKCREWISGFDGSAGTIVVTSNKAALWTDSRYFLQAEIQLKGTGIELCKEAIPGTPSMIEYLSSNLKKGDTVGIDGTVFSTQEADSIKNKLISNNINLKNNFFPFDTIWSDREAAPQDQIFVFHEEISGESHASKHKRIMEKLSNVGANSILLSALDEIAWTLNIRGTDVECNPVAVCYSFISEKEKVIFIDKEKLNKESVQYLTENNISILPYNSVDKFLLNLNPEYKVLIDTSKLSTYLNSSINKECTKILGTSPVAILKSIKNKKEIEGFLSAMIKDGVALVKFFIWLEKEIPLGNVTEMLISEKLIEFREEQNLFVGESFGTIAGFNNHGAIVHYHATSESNSTIKGNGLLLIDSGAQYLDGTTDITRTIVIGDASPEVKHDFTIVLKGHISLAMAKFPKGTRGDQLDVLARQALWNEHKNFLHGTGHGIGHFLNVHEGPQSIRMNHNPVTLEPGMVTSNEPGLYITNKYGIRHENLILTVDDGCSDFGSFYKFETLTLFPFDIKGIDVELLSKEEKNWLNNYHQTVYEKLAPNLDCEEKGWLADKTQNI
ncbi:MAG: aminopeptidase P family protein [Bacteroidales bacterium]|nr:aminopeptidase P family protein [Bacteroidales bacterium]